jgi:hypothetical protein
MRKKLIVSTLVLTALFVANEVSATTYNLFVHGRSGDNHCASLTSTGSGTTDKNNYWSGSVSGISNIRYVGFDGTKSGGAYSWSSCGAQSQLHTAMNTFCKGSNSCRIYTHSTGGLVAAYYLYAVGSSGLNIIDVRLMANASGGSELADFSSSYLGWLGFDTTGGELDNSVSTSGARGWNHNYTGGQVLDLTSGEASDYWGVTSPLLPGQDDGVLANHTLCGINKVADVDSSCTYGTGRMRDSYKCGWLWRNTCYDNFYRWSNYNTVKLIKSHTHGGAKSHYK